MPDSSAIESALLAKLQADTILMGYMPNGVYWDLAPPGSTRYVLVSFLAHHDEPQFGQRSWEDGLYLIKAVGLKTTTNPPNVAAAAARIDELLDPQPPSPPATLTIPGYSLMVLERAERVRYTEVDEIDNTIIWFHRGGQYRLIVAPI